MKTESGVRHDAKVAVEFEEAVVDIAHLTMPIGQGSREYAAYRTPQCGLYKLWLENAFNRDKNRRRRKMVINYRVPFRSGYAASKQ